jgi:hypothetical protein
MFSFSSGYFTKWIVVSNALRGRWFKQHLPARALRFLSENCRKLPSFESSFKHGIARCQGYQLKKENIVVLVT